MTALMALIAAASMQTDGATIHYETFGEGEPLFLLHGGAGNLGHWEKQIPAFAKAFKVYAIDSRGHGKSTRDERPFSYHQMAEDVLAIMDREKLETVSVLGWSDGAATALDLAVNHPARVKRLVFFANNWDLTGLKGGGPHATFKSYFERCAKEYPGDWKAFLAALNPMWKSQPDFTPAQLATVTAKTLVLDGDRDEAIKQDHIRKLATLIPGARFELIADASHFAHWQQPEAFNKAVLDFLTAK